MAFDPISIGVGLVGGLLGGGGGSSDQTITQTNIPEYAAPYFEELLSWGRDEAQREYPLYNDPRIANMTPEQLAAITQIRGLSVPFQIGDASNRAAYASDLAFQTATGWQPGVFETPLTGADRFSGGIADYYMSPYADAVTNIAANTAQRNADIQTARRGLEASRAGAYGGYRHGIQQSEADKSTASLVNDIWTKGRQEAFENAQQQFERDRTADLSTQFANQRAIQEAQRMLESSRQFGAGLGLEASGLGLSAASTLGSLGQMQQQAQLQNIDYLMGAGDMQRQLDQQYMDQQYQDWMDQQNWNRSNLDWYNNLIHGQIGVGGSQTQPGPNMLSQLAGTGLSLAALYRMMGGFG